MVLAYEGISVIDPVRAGKDGLRVVKLVVLVTRRIALCAQCTVYLEIGVKPPESDVTLVVYERGFGAIVSGRGTFIIL